MSQAIIGHRALTGVPGSIHTRDRIGAVSQETKTKAWSRPRPGQRPGQDVDEDEDEDQDLRPRAETTEVKTRLS